MRQGTIKVVDAVSKEVVPLPVTPGTSLLAKSSSQLLNELNIDRLRMPASEMPEVIVQDHLLTLQLSPQHLFETWEEGQLKQIHKGIGSVTLAPSGFRFRGRWDQEVEILVLTLKPAVIARCAAELHDANQTELVRCTGKPDPQIWHLGLALEAEFKEGNPNGQYFWESLTNAIAIRVLKQYSTFEPEIQHYSGSLSPQQLKHAIEYISDNLSSQLSLNVLAAMLGMSPYYFERLFKQSVGHTPHQYILQCRIERAKQLLQTTQLPIMEIAFRVGCKNHSHFSKLFRKLTGMAPKTYRNQL
ncbi:helix-turn-helix domain-containing protein [Leptolyngbya sp. FACHB-261]|uniref:helix-turn-helix domain-containing protein n=1 Tax=Leptolyngbya sp. FACHB-261 TaxID=2692806 RepID=UPI001682D49E|nr:AraC family transcriptional regulator [Leptolyngbya sp. FACHB-261]MBD2105282.1 helix-turn-helix transcriptional regulator [Leptolyngbya sp. FACHB-261]